MRNSCNIFVGKPEGRRPLWGIMCGLEVNIKMYLKKMVCEDVD